jgi:hypothetical protein
MALPTGRQAEHKTQNRMTFEFLILDLLALLSAG